MNDKAPVNQSFILIGILRHIDSIGLRVERPCQPCRRRIPGYFSRSLGHTNAEVNPTMPKMCTRSFHVLQRLNKSGAIYAMYTVVKAVCRTAPVTPGLLIVAGEEEN